MHRKGLPDITAFVDQGIEPRSKSKKPASEPWQLKVFATRDEPTDTEAYYYQFPDLAGATEFPELAGYPKADHPKFYELMDKFLEGIKSYVDEHSHYAGIPVELINKLIYHTLERESYNYGGQEVRDYRNALQEFAKWDEHADYKDNPEREKKLLEDLIKEVWQEAKEKDPNKENFIPNYPDTLENNLRDGLNDLHESLYQARYFTSMEQVHNAIHFSLSGEPTDDEIKRRWQGKLDGALQAARQMKEALEKVIDIYKRCDSGDLLDSVREKYKAECQKYAKFCEGIKTLFAKAEEAGVSQKLPDDLFVEVPPIVDKKKTPKKLKAVPKPKSPKAVPKAKAPKAKAPKAKAPKAKTPKAKSSKALPKATSPKKRKQVRFNLPTKTVKKLPAKKSVLSAGDNPEVGPSSNEDETVKHSNDNLSQEHLILIQGALDSEVGKGEWQVPDELPAGEDHVTASRTDGSGESFDIYADKYETDSVDLETFKAMLVSFKQTNPGENPLIDTNSDRAKSVWRFAFKEVYKDQQDIKMMFADEVTHDLTHDHSMRAK